MILTNNFKRLFLLKKIPFPEINSFINSILLKFKKRFFLKKTIYSSPINIPGCSFYQVNGASKCKQTFKDKNFQSSKLITNNFWHHDFLKSPFFQTARRSWWKSFSISQVSEIFIDISVFKNAWQYLAKWYEEDAIKYFGGVSLHRTEVKSL